MCLSECTTKFPFGVLRFALSDDDIAELRVHGRLQTDVWPLQANGFTRPHTGFQHQNGNVPERLRRRVQIGGFGLVAEYKIPDAFAAE